jgi:acetyl-CoA decarbonylase/synthase complex subunit gamma
MALKAADIQKRLPDGGKKNCKECGLANCFAFAMKLASGAVSLDRCPHLDPATRAELEEAMLPPIRRITVGQGERQVVIGEEEVFQRHQKTFLHPPGLGLLLSDTEPAERRAGKLECLSRWQLERLARISRFDLAALACASGNREEYLRLVREVLDRTPVGIILLAEDPGILLAAYQSSKARRPVVCVTAANADRVLAGLDREAVVCVRAPDVEALAALSARIQAAGFNDLLLGTEAGSLPDLVRDQTLIRRAALVKKHRPLGYPTVVFPSACGDTSPLVLAAGIPKYAGIIILNEVDMAKFQAFLTLRQDIYTDPRVPPTVESKIYEFNQPGKDSSILVTTNFALTYYAVAGEVENSRQAAYLMVLDTGGLCVLASWSAGKLGAESIAEMVRKHDVASRVDRRQLVIPGLVARLKGEVEDELQGWEVVVGPREASEIPGFLPELIRKRHAN